MLVPSSRAERLGLPADPLQGAIEPVVVVPDQLVGALVDAAGPLLAVNHEDACGTDDEMIDVGGRAGHSQVVEDHEAVADQPVQEAGGVALPVGAAPPGARLLGGSPQPPADQRGDRQADQAGLDREHLTDEAGGSDQRCPARPGCESNWPTPLCGAAGRRPGRSRRGCPGCR